MNVLQVVREKFELAKAAETAKSGIVQSNTSECMSAKGKLYPLRNQDQNRLVQIMHRESFSASDIYTTNLHRGLLNDGLGEFAVNGVIYLPSSIILSIVNAALWNSRVRFNSIVGASAADSVSARIENFHVEQTLCLADFVVTGFDVAVLDTRLPGIAQSSATCIQTVLGDDLSVAVYHKIAHGMVRQIAAGRISIFDVQKRSQLVPTSPPTICDIASYRSLRHCYDLPPSFVYRVLRQAVTATGDTTGIGGAFNIAVAKCFWVNNNNLAAFWGAGDKCEVHCRPLEDATGAGTIALALAFPGSGYPWSRVVLYAEFTASLGDGPPVPTADGALWELCSTWVPEAAALNSIALAPVAPRSVLLLSDDDNLSAALASLLPQRAELRGCTVTCKDLQRLNVDHNEHTGASARYDVVLVILPAEETCKSVLSVFRVFATRMSITLVVCDVCSHSECRSTPDHRAATVRLPDSNTHPSLQPRAVSGVTEHQWRARLRADERCCALRAAGAPEVQPHRVPRHTWCRARCAARLRGAAGTRGRHRV
jgi:hypothetical protein